MSASLSNVAQRFKAALGWFLSLSVIQDSSGLSSLELFNRASDPERFLKENKIYYKPKNKMHGRKKTVAFEISALILRPIKADGDFNRSYFRDSEDASSSFELFLDSFRDVATHPGENFWTERAGANLQWRLSARCQFALAHVRIQVQQWNTDFIYLPHYQRPHCIPDPLNVILTNAQTF